MKVTFDKQELGQLIADAVANKFGVNAPWVVEFKIDRDTVTRANVHVGISKIEQRVIMEGDNGTQQKSGGSRAE